MFLLDRCLQAEPEVGPGWQEAAEAALRKALIEWRVELQFVPGDIRVCRFACEDVLIKDLPDFYEAFLEDPLGSEWGDERLRLEWRDRIARWVADGSFVLSFGKEYWMNADGTVEST